MNSSDTTLLVFNDVTAGYSNTPVLRHASLQVREGVHVVVGDNGSGKSTLLRVGAGILRPSHGTVVLLNKDVRTHPEVRAHLGYLGHKSGLFPELTVGDNLLYWMGVRGLTMQPSRERVRGLAAQLGVAHLLYRYVSALSNGQQRLVGVARAALSDPLLLLLDEPCTGMDLESRDRVLALITLLGEESRTVMVATHDPEPLMHITDSVIHITEGQPVITEGQPVRDSSNRSREHAPSGTAVLNHANPSTPGLAMERSIAGNSSAGFGRRALRDQ